MLGSLHKLVVRDDSSDDAGLDPTMINLLIALLVLVFVALALIGALVVLRRKRRSQKQSELPIHNGQCTTTTNAPNHRRLTITAHQNDSMYVYDEKRTLMENSSSPPGSPVPEIRITFPEEEGDAGKRQSRVVVVRLGEKGGVGLEPYQEDLPPYQSTDSQRFQSLDIERMGGLKEKEDEKRWS